MSTVLTCFFQQCCPSLRRARGATRFSDTGAPPLGRAIPGRGSGFLRADGPIEAWYVFADDLLFVIDADRTDDRRSISGPSGVVGSETVKLLVEGR